jgi:hypothetical protein
MESRGVMLPLTDATIAYVVGGILEVRDATTILINRDLASWVLAADDEQPDMTAPIWTPTNGVSPTQPAR